MFVAINDVFIKSHIVRVFTELISTTVQCYYEVTCILRNNYYSEILFRNSSIIV